MLIVYHISVWDSKVIVVLFPLLLCVKPLQTRAFTTRQELCMMQKSSQEKDSGDPFSFFLSLLELSFQVPKKVLSDDLKTKKCCHNDFLKSNFLICENRLKRSYVRCCCNTHFLHKRQKCTTNPCFIISLNAVQVSFTFYRHSKQTLYIYCVLVIHSHISYLFRKWGRGAWKLVVAKTSITQTNTSKMIKTNKQGQFSPVEQTEH